LLRRYATSRTVPGSIPGGVTGFFSVVSPSDRSMALGSTQPLVKMSTRNIPVGKGGRCVRLTISPPSRAECQEIREPKPPGTLWATLGLLRDCFTFTFMGISVTFNHHCCCCSNCKATTCSGVVWLHRRSCLSLQEQVLLLISKVMDGVVTCISNWRTTL
jgi:hypothetical protein